MKDIQTILNDKQQKVAILVDPDKTNSEKEIIPLIRKIEMLNPSFIFVGGSSVNADDFHNCVTSIKAQTSTPVVIFPGSHQQVSENADGILFLSLISGRNPDFLIGHQIESAHRIKKLNLKAIPTGYLLIDGGKTSAVSYVSQTTPIPVDQIAIAVNTAIAGEMLGLKVIFLDAGSGASTPVPPEMIREVKKNINVPLIIGGGIRTTQQLNDTLKAGADLVVIGNKIEENIDFLLDIKNLMKDYA